MITMRIGSYFIFPPKIVVCLLQIKTIAPSFLFTSIAGIAAAAPVMGVLCFRLNFPVQIENNPDDDGDHEKKGENPHGMEKGNN